MIEVTNVVKRFVINKKEKNTQIREADTREQGKYFHAVQDISFTADRGRILGLLGPNGAGKTTLLRMLSTALKPTSGQIMIDGVDAITQPTIVRHKIGFLTGNTGLYGRLTVAEMVAYFGKLHGLHGTVLKERMNALFTELDMNQFKNKSCEKLSFGMKQKANIARTLIHDPDIIVFDEPTTGLDVQAAETILALVERLRDEGKTVLFSTHHMSEVDRLCDEVLLIGEGQTKFRGTVAEMRLKSGHQHLNNAFLNLLKNVA